MPGFGLRTVNRISVMGRSWAMLGPSDGSILGPGWVDHGSIMGRGAYKYQGGCYSVPFACCEPRSRAILLLAASAFSAYFWSTSGLMEASWCALGHLWAPLGGPRGLESPRRQKKNPGGEKDDIGSEHHTTLKTDDILERRFIDHY